MTAARQGSSADPAALMRMDAATVDLIKFLVTRAICAIHSGNESEQRLRRDRALDGESRLNRRGSCQRVRAVHHGHLAIRAHKNLRRRPVEQGVVRRGEEEGRDSFDENQAHLVLVYYRKTESCAMPLWED